MFRGQAAQRDETGPAQWLWAPEECDCRGAEQLSDELAARPAIRGTAFVAILNHDAAARIGTTVELWLEVRMSSSPELSDDREGPEARREEMRKICRRDAAGDDTASVCVIRT